jgi:iron complex outermembrane receptor protein
MKITAGSLLLFLSFTALSNEKEPVIDLADEFNDINLESILTSTKLITSRQDAPLSITKITAEQITRNKYRNVPEALRSVAGMVVIESHTNQLMYNVGYHGGSAVVPRRMNVLIDGVSFYQSGFARVKWELLPVSMNNIYSIEVVRGAVASLYGSNSFTSVVNITTKTAKQTSGKKNEIGFFSNVFVGDGGVFDTTLRFTHLLKKTGFNLTYTHKEDDGFDKTSNDEERRDSKEIDSLVLQINHELSPKQFINATLSTTQEDVQQQFVAPIQTTYPDYKINANYAAITYINEAYESHNFKVLSYIKNDKHKQSWNAIVPAMTLSPELTLMFEMNPTYALSLASGTIPFGGSASDDIQAYAVLQRAISLSELGIDMISATVFQNYTEKKYYLEIQDTYKYSDNLRVIIGGSIDYSTTTNYDWVISNPQSIRTERIFSNAEYSLTEDWLMNIGASYEHDENSGGSLSPRIALNNSYFNNISLRFIYSTAERTPDTFEQKANWRYVGTNLSVNPFNSATKLPYFVKAVAKGNLEAEKVASYEIGMLYESNHHDFTFDLRIFNEKQTSLISERLTLTDFNPTNNGSSDIQGAEFELKYQITQYTLLNSSYSYVDVRGTKNEQTLAVNNIFHASINQKINDQFSVNFYYYGLSHFLSELNHNFADPYKSPSFDLFDLNVSFKKHLQSIGQLELSLHMKHRNKHSEFERDNLYDDSNAFFLNANLSF